MLITFSVGWVSCLRWRCVVWLGEQAFNLGFTEGEDARNLCKWIADRIHSLRNLAVAFNFAFSFAFRLTLC